MPANMDTKDDGKISICEFLKTPLRFPLVNAK